MDPVIPAAADDARRDRVGLSVRLDTDLRDRLAKEADARDVSLSWLVNRLLRRSLDEALLRPTE